MGRLIQSDCRAVGSGPEQPVYLGLRDDVAPSDCLLGQLKIKAALDLETNEDQA